MNARIDQPGMNPRSTFAQRIRQWFVDWLIKDLHLRGVSFGENSITLSPSGVGDVARWSATQAAAALGDLGMNTTTGRPSAFIGGVARDLLGDHEIIQPDGSVTFTADQPMGGFHLTGMGAGSVAGDSVRYEQVALLDGSQAFTGTIGGVTPSAASDLATKGYVDNLVTGIAWKPPVDVDGYIGNLAASAIEALSPTSGDTYVVSTADGAGALSTATVGDVWQYVGTTWTKIITGSGGFVPADTVLLVATETVTLVSPLTDNTDEGSCAQFDGTSLTPSAKIQPNDGDAVLVKGEGALNENKAYVYDGTAPSGDWIQFQAAAGDHGALSGLVDDDHTQYALLAGRIGGQVLRGGTDPSDILSLFSTSNATKGKVTVGDNSEIVVDSANVRVGFGTGIPATKIHMSSLGSGEILRVGPTGGAAGSILPGQDNTGALGTGAFRWASIRGTVITSGDHNFLRPDRGAAWTVTEFPDGLYAVNRVTGQWYEMGMKPCAARCPDNELAPVGGDLAEIAAK